MSLALLLLPPPSPPAGKKSLFATSQLTRNATPLHAQTNLPSTRYSSFTCVLPAGTSSTPSHLGNDSLFSSLTPANTYYTFTLTPAGPSHPYTTCRHFLHTPSLPFTPTLPACILPPSTRTPTAGSRSSIQRKPLCCAYLSSFLQKEKVGKKDEEKE